MLGRQIALPSRCHRTTVRGSARHQVGRWARPSFGSNDEMIARALGKSAPSPAHHHGADRPLSQQPLRLGPPEIPAEANFGRRSDGVAGTPAPRLTGYGQTMGIPATGDRRTTHFFMVKSRFVVTPIPAPGPRTFSRARWPGRARVACAQGPPRRSPATTPSAAGNKTFTDPRICTTVVERITSRARSSIPARPAIDSPEPQRRTSPDRSPRGAIRQPCAAQLSSTWRSGLR